MGEESSSVSNAPVIVQVYQEALALMKQHGLIEQGWTFGISNEKRFLGRCYYTSKVITYSKYFLHVPQAQITDTLLHEIAHALVGPGHHHNNVWRNMAIRVGAKPERCARGVTTSAQPNYVLECAKCKQRWYRFRIKAATHRLRHCNVPIKIYRVRKET